MRHPTFQHQADDFWAIYKRSTCAVERRRSQLLALLVEGKSYAEVLAITRYSYQGADKIVDAYEAQGLDRIKDQRHGNRGAPTLLSDADLLLLAQSIRADVAEGGVWNRNRVQEWVKTQGQLTSRGQGGSSTVDSGTDRPSRHVFYFSRSRQLSPLYASG